MRSLTSFVAMLLLFITAAPVLACASDSGLSHEERACCQAMHGNCGEMAKTGCCQTQLGMDAYPQLAANAPHVRLVQVFVEWVAPVVAPLRANLSASFRSPDQHSPPGPRLAQLSVLRI